MLQSWIHRKAKDGSFWQTIVSSESILRIAFSIASKPNPHNAEQHIVGIASFKQYLIHLFVLSVLWVHFKHADEWTAGEDLGMERLSLQKFKMACRTFSSAQAHEHLTDEILAADFAMLDADNSGTIEFAEVMLQSIQPITHRAALTVFCIPLSVCCPIDACDGTGVQVLRQLLP